MKKVMTMLTVALVAPPVLANDEPVNFTDVDSNKDGAITRQEAASFAPVERGFDKVDANRNGLLERQEFYRLQASKGSERK